MSLIVESGPIKSPNLLDVFRLLTFDKLLSNSNIECIRYIGPKKSVAVALHQLSQKRKIIFDWEKTPTLSNEILVRRIWSKLPKTLRSFIWFIKFVYKHWSLKTSSIQTWFKGSNSVFVLSYFANLDKNSGESGKFYSNQWGVFPKLLLNTGKFINWAHLFIFSNIVKDTSTGIRWLESFNKDKSKQGSHIFYSHLLISN